MTASGHPVDAEWLNYSTEIGNDIRGDPDGTIHHVELCAHCPAAAWRPDNRLHVEQQQRMITGRREVPVVGTLLLLVMDSDLGAYPGRAPPAAAQR